MVKPVLPKLPQRNKHFLQFFYRFMPMKIVSWNVNGIRAVHKRRDLDWIFSSDIDIVCLQETKAHPEQLESDLTTPKDLTTWWSAGIRKGYSGTSTWVRQPLHSEQLQAPLGTEALDQEGRIVLTEVEGIRIYNVYFPNGGSGPARLAYKLEFHQAFLKRMQYELAAGYKIVVLGDYNVAHRDIDVDKPEEWAHISGCLPQERAWYDAILQAGFIDTFRFMHGDRPKQYTWWNNTTFARERNEGWRIDVVMISQNLEHALTDAWIDSGRRGSDHCPIGIELHIPFSKHAVLNHIVAPHIASHNHDDAEDIYEDDDEQGNNR
jgi:exodeoxyribonuclease-3